jgi:hypothetical protein
VSVFASPHIVAKQWVGGHVPVTKNTRNNRTIVGGFVFYMVRVVSKESPRVSVYLPTVAGQWLGKHPLAATRIVGGVVFYAARVISKDRRLLVLPRTSCFMSRFLTYYS